jgi:hypothetical protein
MQDALRGLLVLLQAAEAFRNGPANGTRVRKPMKCLEITPWPIIPIPFSWTFRNATSASEFDAARSAFRMAGVKRRQLV